MRGAALSVGTWVAAASAVFVVIGVIAAIATVSAHSRHEHAEHGAGTPDSGDLVWVIDRDAVIVLVVIVGILAMIVLGGVAWIAARKAVVPLQNALRLQENFVADASHELRTPLTVLSTRIQLLEWRLSRNESPDDLFPAVRADIESMSQILDDLLVAAEGAPADDRATALLGETITESIERVQPLAESRGVSLTSEIPANVHIRMSPIALRRAIIALADNAIHFSPTGGTVRIAATVVGGFVRIRVIDQGSGFSGDDPTALFERFARAEGAVHEHRGFGLGLALVRDIARRYDGTIAIEKTGPEGTVMLLSLRSA